MNITCSAIPETLLESELFGHERGAFTDARQQKRGLLESADGGTVFLDEIGEMVPALQAKLLRVLEEKAFKRVGGQHDVRVDVRIVAATNRNLEEQVKGGHFRSDLYYRLNVLPIELPPLRAHLEDVPALVAFYVDQFNREFRKTVRGASPTALTAMQHYGWPGISANCATSSSGPCCSPTAPGSSPWTSRHLAPARLWQRGVAARRGRQSRGTRAQPCRAGPRTVGWQPDPCRHDARPQPRPDSLPHREIRSREDDD